MHSLNSLDVYVGKQKPLLNTSIWIFYRQRCSYLSMWCQPIHLEMLHFSDFFQWNHTKGIRRDMNDVVLWAPFHLRCYSFKLQLWPGSHASWAFSFSIAPMSCLATTGFFSGDNVLPWNPSLHHIQILTCHFLLPLAFSRPVRSLAANKALHRRSSRVWCCCGTSFFNCCDWEREHKASMVDMFAWRHQHRSIPFKWDVLFHAIYIFCFCVSGGSSGRDVSASFDSFEAVEFTPWGIIINHQKKSSSIVKKRIPMNLYSISCCLAISSPHMFVFDKPLRPEKSRRRSWAAIKEAWKCERRRMGKVSKATSKWKKDHATMLIM